MKKETVSVQIYIEWFYNRQDHITVCREKTKGKVYTTTGRNVKCYSFFGGGKKDCRKIRKIRCNLPLTRMNPHGEVN